MNHSSNETHPVEHTERGSIKAYIAGLLVSSILTFLSFFSVTEKWFTGWNLVLAISTFGVMQALVQLILFLHLGQESKPRWNLAVFLFMALVLVVIVFGSLWIMNNLNYRLMSPM